MSHMKNAFNNNKQSFQSNTNNNSHISLNPKHNAEKHLSQNTPNTNYNHKPFDEEYAKMIHKRQLDLNQNSPKEHITGENHKIFVVVRKRPLSAKEILNREIDCITTINPKITIHECKIKIDGITKYIEDHQFTYDNVFSETNTTNDVYNSSIRPMIDLVLNKGIVTCFAYGQTGSGKTYTMKGIQDKAIDDLYTLSKGNKVPIKFHISFYEIYGGRLYDLLNNRTKLQVFDDKNGKVQIFGLEEVIAESAEEMKMIIDKANAIRTTHNTVTNEESSRSHAVCSITVQYIGLNEYGKLLLVDLAGSERANETQSNNKQRRAEGAEINKSLLALKECIRALDDRRNGDNGKHVPFRASKLTHVLRDSFLSKDNNSKIVMISCVNPSYCSSNHSINTLRYAERLKDQSQSVALMTKNKDNQKHYNFSHRVMTVPSSKTTNGSDHSHSHSNSNSNNSHHSSDDKQSQIDLIKEIEDINIDSNIFNSQDDNICDIDFDDKVKKESVSSLLLYEPNPNQKTLTHIVNLSNEDNASTHCHQQSSDIIGDEGEDLLNSHMEVIKEDAKFLTEEGELISNIKHLGSNQDFTLEEYLPRLEAIIDKKVLLYSGLQSKLNIYINHIKNNGNKTNVYIGTIDDNDI